MKKIIGIAVNVLCLVACTTTDKNQTETREYTTEDREVSVYTTADTADLRLTLTGKLFFKPAEQPLETEIALFVNPNQSFQTFLGIGGAITDASAEVFALLPETKQEEFLTAYYDRKEGIGYTLARTSIHSCDFSSESYTYVRDGDKELETFNIAHDKQYRIPLIKKAIEAAGGNLILFASPWSPPGFMKDNNQMLRGGKLLPEYFESWALYYTKYIKAYENEGIPVWGITIQNEPMATQRWESCIYTAEEERDFLKNHLGPTMEREGLGDKKIIVWDHNRDLMSHRANTIFEDQEASKYAWGMGFHWYETWTGGQPMYDNLADVHESYPSKNLLFTEGCVGGFNPEGYQQWSHAERYGQSMINDFNRGTVGWCDWNILLDETGGPNHVKNFCFAPVHADTQKGELIFTPTFYYIGHFSRFIHPGAARISTTSSRSPLLCTSFMDTDGNITTVVMNQSSKEVMYKMFIGQMAIELTILPHAIQTLVY